MSYPDGVTRFALIVFLALAASAEAPPAGGIRITLERKGSGMDLSMPVYSVAIEGDGAVLYEGRNAVHAVGIRKRRIPPAAVRQLVQTLTDKGYFDLPTSYGVCEDGSTVKTSFEMSGRVKKIVDSCGAGSATLRQMEDEIDKAAGSGRWVHGRIRTLLH
jgi:hypothetical protein